MDQADMKRIAQTMVENGGFDPKLVTEDFEFSIEAHPTSHVAAGRPHPASEMVPGLERLKELFRYPDEDGPGDGLKTIIRSLTAEEDRVVVEAITRGVPKADPSRLYVNYIAGVYVFRDGKVAKARVYEDTAFAQAFERGGSGVVDEITTAMHTGS